MNQLTLNLSTEINTLHERLSGLARTSLETAIEIGELLTRQKSELNHGEWLPWCRENLEFSQATATKYLAFYRDRMKLLATSNLGIEEAYRLLSQPALPEEPESETLVYFADLAEEDQDEPSTVAPVLETSEQKAAAWDLAEELAEEEGTPVNQKHIQQATEAVSAVPAADESGVVATTEEVKEEAKKHVHVAQNSGENEWYTPPQFIESARLVMGSIDTDPASNPIANATVKATRFFTKDEDGLQQKWQGNVWMNPPYAQPLMSQFAGAISEKFENGEIGQAIILVNNATETQWFQRMASVASAVCFPKTRVRFLDPQGKPGAPLQGQAIIYFGAYPSRFVDEFTQYGATFS